MIRFMVFAYAAVGKHPLADLLFSHVHHHTQGFAIKKEVLQVGLRLETKYIWQFWLILRGKVALHAIGKQAAFFENLNSVEIC